MVVEGSGGCALCGLDLGRGPVVRNIDGCTKCFCCAGCATVYEFAHRNGQLGWALEHLQANEPAPKRLLAPGEKVYFALDGMQCATCAGVVERILAGQPGVTAVEVSYAAERGYLRYEPGQTTPEAALRSLERLGYRPSLVADAAEERADRRQDRVLWQFFIALGFGMNIMALYLNQLYHFYAAGQFDLPLVRGLQYLMWALATPVLFLGGISFPLGAYRALRARTASMDTLVTLGIFSAYGYSVYITLTGGGQTYFDSVAMIVTFVTLGRYLETVGGAQARKGIRKLLGLQPARAQRKAGQSWQEVPATDLAAGDVVLVRPGERVPADGEVLEGEGALDESVLTGESTPVEKGPGDAVFAGTLLADAALTCCVTRPPGDTRLAQITRLVEQTLGSKPPIQRLADMAASYLALGILAAAILTALGWRAAGHAPAQALLAAVAVLVVACPCALGLATPLGLAITLGRASEEGILVRNPASLEAAPRVQRVVFDKTGTLTRGHMSVVDVQVGPEAGMTGDELLRLAAAVEQYSEHPVARAIVEAAPGAPRPAEGFAAARGMGASALVSPGAAASAEPRRVLVGSQGFLQVSPEAALSPAARAHAECGETVIWVGWEGTLAGFIALRDEPSPTAAGALGRLEAVGVWPVMLSGDNSRTVRVIADTLGLTEYEGDRSPQEKAARIEAWQNGGEVVAMVGDGVNDAPALAQADLSITVAGGTDVAGEASDVVLTWPDLTLVPEFIQLSRRARQVIRLNLAWALAYNLVTVPLAAIGLISPAIAAATMTASSLLVVGNSLRLRS